MVFFWLHDLIPGYALEQDKWVQKCLLSMFLEWSAVPFFMEPSVSRRVRWMMRASFFFFLFLFQIVWFISRSNPHLYWPPPACVGLIRQRLWDIRVGIYWQCGGRGGLLFMCMVFTPPLRHMLMICFCLSVERSQGIVLLEMSFICLPFYPPTERVKEKGGVVLSVRYEFCTIIVYLYYWDIGIGVRNRGSRLQKDRHNSNLQRMITA